jgi:hypothetical protein
MGRKTTALSALPELWWVRRSTETGQGLAWPKIQAAGFALSKKAGAAFIGCAGLSRRRA